MIASSSKGRLRLRHPDFFDPSLNLEAMRKVPGVAQVEHNPKTGSVLILYDPATVDLETAESVLAELDPEALAEGPPTDPQLLGTPPDKTLNETVGMLVCLLALTASGFFKAKKLHVMAGLFFLEMAAEHLWRLRRRARGKFDLLSFLGLRKLRPGGKRPVGPHPEEALTLEMEALGPREAAARLEAAEATIRELRKSLDEAEARLEAAGEKPEGGR
jgi:hypothetical protein